MQDQNVNKERNLRLETKADTHLPLAIGELPCDIILIYVTKILKAGKYLSCKVGTS